VKQDVLVKINPGFPWQMLCGIRRKLRDARNFNNIEKRAVIKFFFSPLQGKAPKKIHAVLTETLTCFLPGRAKDLSAPLYQQIRLNVRKKPFNFYISCLPFYGPETGKIRKIDQK